ncbi:RIC1 protein [Cryptosporidium felis]|nr:RIC1 protein [Cryptosporidium felis]
MIIPLVDDSRTYDGILNGDLIGSKISPCENYIALVTKESLQIVSNRHNRVLVSRYTLKVTQGQTSNTFGTFSGLIEWSKNSRLLVLGSSTQQHLFFFELLLHSPLEISNETGYISRSDTSEESEYLSETELGKEITDQVSLPQVSENDYEGFVFITEELENGLANAPSINVPDEVFDNFQEDLLSFQLITEYGTLTEKCEISHSETSIDFSTSYVKLEVLGVSSTFYKYESFLLTFDHSKLSYAILISLKELPIVILKYFSSASVSSRRNLFLSDFVSLTNCSESRSFDSRDGLRSTLSSHLYGPNSKEIKLENLDRPMVSAYIESQFRTHLAACSWDSHLRVESLMETLISCNRSFSSPGRNFMHIENFNGIGIGNLKFNEKFDLVTMLVKPFNSLLLFPWKEPLGISHGQDSDRTGGFNIVDYESSSSCTEDCASLSVSGFVIRASGILEYSMLAENPRIIAVVEKTSSSLNEEVEDMLFNCEHEDKDFGSSDNPQNLEELVIEVLSFEERISGARRNGFNINFGKLNCTFSLSLSKYFTRMDSFAAVHGMNISKNDRFVVLTLEKYGILVLDCFSGKMAFKIEDERRNRNETSSFTSDNHPKRLFKHARMISNDLAFLYQIKDENFSYRLIEIPVYRLIDPISSVCRLVGDRNDKPSCENLVFLGLESFGIAQCSSRNLGLDSIESCPEKYSESTSKKILETFVNQNSVSLTKPSGFEYRSKLTIESIPIPPSIYINHNWPISGIFVNQNGSLALVSGYRGCAIYDLRSGRWRLFCDLFHELLLCKPNLPFGWITEWVFFLCVDSNLLLNTIHNLIVSENSIWEISAFEKNKLYERYIESLTFNIRSGGEEVCVVFFDARNALDIRNVVGLIPSCSSTPLLIANVPNSQNSPFIVYTDDFVLTAYDSRNSQSFSFEVSSEKKWAVDLSSSWSSHPLEILLVRETGEYCSLLILHRNQRLYRLTVFYRDQSKSGLEKNCEFRLEPAFGSAVGAFEDSYYSSIGNISKFGFVEFPIEYEDFEKDETVESENQTADPRPESLLEDAISLLREAEFNASNFDLKELLGNKVLHDFVWNQENSKVVSFKSGRNSLYCEGDENTEISSFVWLFTEAYKIWLIPLTSEESAEYKANFDTVRNMQLSPIAIHPSQMSPKHKTVVNFFPELASFIILEPLTIKEVPDSNPDICEIGTCITLNQSLSPIILNFIQTPDYFSRLRLMSRLLRPIIDFLELHPLESITDLATSIFEELLYPLLKDSCKEYKKNLDTQIESMIMLSKESGLLSEINDIKPICDFVRELFFIVGPNLKLCSLNREQGVVEMTQNKAIWTSSNALELKNMFGFIKKVLRIGADFCLEEKQCESNNISVEILTYLAVSMVRKIDPVVAPCIVFPILGWNPVELFQLSLRNKSFRNAMLYLTILQSFTGPYFVRYEHSLSLLHCILLNMSIINSDKLLPLARQILKFIFIVFKPDSVNMRAPLTKQPGPISIIGLSNCNNLQLDCLVFLNKIDSILEFHFISKLIQIEWASLLLTCKALNMNFNVWLSHCTQKFNPLWLSNENSECSNPYSSPKFFNLVIAIQHKFNLFNIKENSISLFEDFAAGDYSETPEFAECVSSRINKDLLSSIHLENQPNFLQENNKLSQKALPDPIIKIFFNAFLSNSIPIPALAIAYACNDVYSVHKLLHDFPNM